MAGLALGLVASLWGARFVAPLLFEIDAYDPLTFAVAAGVPVAVAPAGTFSSAGGPIIRAGPLFRIRAVAGALPSVEPRMP